MFLKFGSFEVDLRAGELRKNGTRLRLQEKPLRVLELLADCQGQTVSREELKKHLWPDDTFVDFETGLNTAVKKLRGALADDADNPRYIETIPRRGYRLLVSVEFVESPAPASENLETPGSSSPVTPAQDSPAALTSPATETRGTQPAKSRARSRFWIPVALVVAMLAGVAYWLTSGHAAFSFHARDSVLIADFENQTGDPRFDNALSTAFTVSIEQSRYANIFPRMRLDSVLNRMKKTPGERITSALGREICLRENVRGLVACSITRTGQEFALTAQLIDPQTGESVRSYTEHSYGEDHILDALDVLSKEVREGLGESLYQIHQAGKPLPQVTTPSLNALRQYADGSALWQHGKYREAVTLYKAAVDSDPDFAIAHAALGNAYYSYIFTAPRDGQKEYEKALSLSSRTTERERMLIEVQYALGRNHVDEAMPLLQAYLNRYPDDLRMRYNYGNVLREHDRLPQAVEQYQLVLQLASDFAPAYTNLATAFHGLNKLPEAIQAYEKAFQLEPQMLTSGNINREYGFTLVQNGEDQKAEKTFLDLLDDPDTRENGLRSLALLDLYHGKYRQAQERLQQSLEMLESQNSPLSLGRVELLLAIVAEGQGDTNRQKRALDAAWSQWKDVQLKVPFGAMVGDAYVRAGFIDQARKIEAQIAPLTDAKDAKQTGYLHLLQGEIALAAGQSDTAIELLKQAEKEYHTAMTIEALANGLQQTKNVDQAIAHYEELIHNPSSGYLGAESQQRWLQAHYVLASDYISRRQPQKAYKVLETLLRMWQGADADLPLLKLVKVRMIETFVN
jgi:DNA-binding winged helix-turn-helix (wHTH) protein/tetratricopeptide (TPR) repeat protein